MFPELIVLLWFSEPRCNGLVFFFVFFFFLSLNPTEPFLALTLQLILQRSHLNGTCPVFQEDIQGFTCPFSFFFFFLFARLTVAPLTAAVMCSFFPPCRLSYTIRTNTSSVSDPFPALAEGLQGSQPNFTDCFHNSSTYFFYFFGY